MDLRILFQRASRGDTVVIPAGKYVWDGEIELKSGLRVFADGAVFAFPEKLPRDHVRWFTGENLHDFSWQGGTFRGFVYDPEREANPWQPNAETVAIAVIGGENLSFSQICGEHLAGPVVFVSGEEDAYVSRVTVRDITSELCGKFMWDYGYLWQRITYPEHHSETEVQNAYRYMPACHYSDALHFDGKYITSPRLPQKQIQDDTVTFFGEKLPREIKKGKYYYAEEENGGLVIREKLGDDPITFASGDYDCRLFRGMYQVFHAMYAPFGSGMSKGSVDIRYAEEVSVTGCRISAPGDLTHFHHCRHGVIRENILSGARMGAMFLSAGCEDMLVAENIVDGGNGSRVLTVETGGRNIRIENNIFKNGGRGTWIDTPHGIFLRGNLFEKNTCKATPDPAVGRLSPTEGTFERFAEIYFTTRQHGAVYGDIVMEDNRIVSGERSTAAVAFLAHGKNIRVKGNCFDGGSRDICVTEGCENADIGENPGMGDIVREIPRESFDIPGTVYLPDGMRK